MQVHKSFDRVCATCTLQAAYTSSSYTSCSSTHALLHQAVCTSSVRRVSYVPTDLDRHSIQDLLALVIQQKHNQIRTLI